MDHDRFYLSSIFLIGRVSEAWAGNLLARLIGSSMMSDFWFPIQDGCVHGTALVAFPGPPGAPVPRTQRVQPEPKEEFRYRETSSEPPVRTRTRGLQRASLRGHGVGVRMPRKSRALPGAPQGGAAAGRPACDCECACALRERAAVQNWVCQMHSNCGKNDSTGIWVPSQVRQCLVHDTHLCANDLGRTEALLNVVDAFCDPHAPLHAFRNWTVGIYCTPGTLILLSSVLKLHARLTLRPQRKMRREV